MTGQCIRDIESGRRYPSRDVVERLAEALDAPGLVDEYFTGEDAQDVRGLPALVAAVKRLMRKMGLQ